MQQTISQMMRNNSRLEQERNSQSAPVFIDAISEDQATAVVRLVEQPRQGQAKNDKLTVPILGVYDPNSIHIALNVSNFNGILVGDPKAPKGVMLVPKARVEQNIRHGVSEALYGSGAGRPSEHPDRVVKREPTNTDQALNLDNLPNGQMIVLKPGKKIPAEFLGKNPFINNAPTDLMDPAGAYMLVSEDEVRAVSDSGTGIVINARSGVNIAGKVNIGSSIQDVRIGGAWRLNPMLQFQIPSTAVTPIPTLLYDWPGKDVLDSMGSYMDDLKA